MAGDVGDVGADAVDSHFRERGDPVGPIDGPHVDRQPRGVRGLDELLVDGRVKCWGGNPYGAIGWGDVSVRGVVPSRLGDPLPFVELGAGVAGTALAWGLGLSGAGVGGGAVVWGGGWRAGFSPPILSPHTRGRWWVGGEGRARISNYAEFGPSPGHRILRS